MSEQVTETVAEVPAAPVAPVAEAPAAETAPEPAGEVAETTAPAGPAPEPEPEDKWWETDVDWTTVDTTKEDWLSGFDERVHPLLQGLQGLHQGEVDALREDQNFMSKLYESAMSNGTANPAHMEVAQKLEAAEVRLGEKDTRIAELEAKLERSQTGYEQYRGGHEEQAVQEWVNSHIDEIKASSPEDIQTFQELAGDLGMPGDDAYDYISPDIAWRATKLGLGDTVKEMNAEGVGPKHVIKLVEAMEKSAAPAKPKSVPPSPSATAIAGTDKGPRQAPKVRAKPKEKPVSGSLRQRTSSILDKHGFQ